MNLLVTGGSGAFGSAFTEINAEGQSAMFR